MRDESVSETKPSSSRTIKRKKAQHINNVRVLSGNFVDAQNLF
jgi:hypothetical protein